MESYFSLKDLICCSIMRTIGSMIFLKRHLMCSLSRVRRRLIAVNDSLHAYLGTKIRPGSIFWTGFSRIPGMCILMWSSLVVFERLLKRVFASSKSSTAISRISSTHLTVLSFPRSRKKSGINSSVYMAKNSLNSSFNHADPQRPPTI